MKKTWSMILSMVMALSLLLVGASCTTEKATEETTAAAAETTAAETTAAAASESEAVAVDADQPLKGMKIGCTIVYKGDEWCANSALELERMGKALGAEIVVQDGDINDETQSKQIENMIADNVDMIFCDPATPDGCTEALNKAVAAGIPIFIFDGFWNQDKAVTTVTWNQPLTGELIADYVIDYVDKNLEGKANVVLLNLKASTHCIEREDRYKEVIAEKNPNIVVISEQDCEGNREKGANAITNIVEPFDLVVSVVDNGAWGAISALQARGLDDVKVFSMGAYGQEPFDALKNQDPHYQACVVVPPAEMVKSLYDAAVKHFKGEPVEKITEIKISVADAANVDEFWDFAANTGR